MSSSSRAAPAVQAPMSDSGLGLAGVETEDDDITPTQSRLRISKGLKDVVPDGVTNPLDYIPNREWDTNMMRNVTVRRKRPQPPKPVNTDVEPLAKSRDGLPGSPRAAESNAQQSPHTPSTAGSPRDLGWSPLRQSMVSHTRNGSDPKRMSTLSTSSTIVEAVVIATPPQRQRTLRHVSKKVILRSDSGSSSESSPMATSNAASFSPKEAPERLLQHMQASTKVARPTRRKPTVPAVPLKHHRESESLRMDAAKSAKRQRDSKPQSFHHDVLPFDPVHDSQPLEITKSASEASVETQIGINPRSDEKLSDTASPKVKFTDSTKALADQKELNGVSATTLTRSATQKALREIIPIAAVEKENNPSKPKEKLPTEEPLRPAINEPSLSDDVVRRPSIAKSHSGSSSLSPSKALIPVVDGHRVRRSLDDSAVEEIRRYSFDRSTIGTHEYTRSSFDRSHTEEHAMLRHLYSQVTPFSQISDVPESLEVSEATAINIYPHNNHSLLVVQQGARPTQVTPLVRRNTTGSASPREPPLLTVQPSTPPPQVGKPNVNVDSPLKNPRPPPDPPAIKILPATPLSELDASPIDTAGRAMQLYRRPTLVQRARRYSDTLFHPLIARTRSIRRNVSTGMRNRGASSEPAGGGSDSGKLHPFWHPRGFWDDVSDSDSEFGNDEGAEYYHEPWEGDPGVGDGEEGTMRLPPGGDTSDIGAESRGVIRGVLDGFRESGGFMIGNSLGLERGLTNRRRHYVNVPIQTGLERSRDGRVRKKDSQGSLGRVQMQGQMQEERKRRVWKGMGLHFEYVGISGLKEVVKERNARKRRDKLKSSIGTRWTVEGAPQV